MAKKRTSGRPKPAAGPSNPPFAVPDWPATTPKLVPLHEIVPYERNPRTHPPEQITLLAQLMKDYGVDQPIVVDEAGVVLKGHGRLLAAQEAGFETFPVAVHRGLDENSKRAIRIADNQVALLSGWDSTLIGGELAELNASGFDMPLLGFSQTQLVDWGIFEREGQNPDVLPAVPAVSVIKNGDLWVLGEHRLMCGDSTRGDDVSRLMDGKRAVLFSTDPPYAVGYTGGSHPASDANRGNANRDKNWSTVYEEATQKGDGEVFYNEFISVARAHAIDERAAWYCWHSSIRAPMVERVWNANGAFAHQQIIWVKTRAVLTYSVYMWQHEPCLMGWIRGKKPRIRSRKTEFQTTVWSVPNSEIESADHPTSKPTRLFRVPMDVHTQAGDVCYEPFSGSGSQIIAAEMLKRKCYAMEISPVFVEVAIERWQNYTNRHATLDGKTFTEVQRERQKRGRHKAAPVRAGKEAQAAQ